VTQSVPKVTIGVPIYNGANFLRQALDTVAAQTFTDFEVLLCDNASTDETASICREYVARDCRFRYFPSETNRGASWNYNRALDMCQSPYLIWIAHDDRWRPTLLEKCVETMESDPEVSLVYPRSVFIDEQNRELWHFDADLHLRDPDPVKRFTQFVRRYAKADFCNPVFGLHRVSTLRHIPAVAPYPGSDMIMLSEVALNGLVHEVPDVLFERRDHPKRSIRACATISEIADWFLPGSGQKTNHSIRVWTIKFAEGIWRSNHPLGVKLQCYAALMTYYVAPQLPRYGRKLVRQALAFPGQALRRL
jgi:glycosyltransferase involved in cell wall biosynthesis